MFEYYSIISGFLYLIAIYHKNVIWKYILKPGTMLCIIVAAIEKERMNKYKKSNIKIKLLGLTFSIIGDIFLMFQGENMFLLGLLSFLFAHIAYIFMFYYIEKKYNYNFKLKVFLFIISSVYFLLIYTKVLKNGGYFMVISVIIYIITITIMVYKSSLTSNPFLLLSALLFYTSDAILAWDKFIINNQNSNLEYFVMITYYVSQLLIATNN